MTTSIRMSLAKRMKHLRSEKSLTQSELAKRAGINRSYFILLPCSHSKGTLGYMMAA